jgi:hypothetical protein
MVWEFFKKIFGKSEEEGYVESEDVPVEHVEAVVSKHSHKKEEKEEVHEEHKSNSGNRIANDPGFVRYICGKCFKWSEFKKGSVPSSCPYCHCSDKTKFKPQRGQ